MNENFDSIFTEEKTTPAPAETQTAPFSKEEYAAEKNAEREAVYDLANKTTQEVATNGQTFKNYLSTLSRFELYSATNTLLIFAQRPNATRLRDYDTWKEAGTPVWSNQFNNGVSILKRQDYRNDDGSFGYNWNVKKLYDVSQTKANPEPSKTPAIKALCQALVKSSKAKIQLVDELSGDAKGTLGAQYLPGAEKIEIVKGLDGQSIFRCLSQEVACANNEGISNFTAYAASFALCEKYGIDTEGYDFSKAPEYFSTFEDKEVRREIGAVRDTVADIASSINKNGIIP